MLLLLPVVFSAVSYPPAVVCALGNPVLLAPSPFVPVEYKDSDYPLTNPRKPSEVVLLTSCLQSQLQHPQTVKLTVFSLTSMSEPVSAGPYRIDRMSVQDPFQEQMVPEKQVG